MTWIAGPLSAAEPLAAKVPPESFMAAPETAPEGVLFVSPNIEWESCVFTTVEARPVTTDRFDCLDPAVFPPTTKIVQVVSAGASESDAGSRRQTIGFQIDKGGRVLDKVCYPSRYQCSPLGTSQVPSWTPSPQRRNEQCCGGDTVAAGQLLRERD